MASQGFSFPPPPPPPPQQHASGFHPSVPVHNHGYPHGASNGLRGRRGSAGGQGHHRGRGRGDGNHGRRGGYLATRDAGHANPYRHSNPPPSPTPAVTYPRFTSQTQALPAPSNATAPYPVSSFPPRHVPQPAFSPRSYTQTPPSHLSPYPTRPNYDAGYGASTKSSHPPPQPPSAGYAVSVPPPLPPYQPASNTPPPMLAPPMRWGGDNMASRGFYSNTTRVSKLAPPHRPNPIYSNSYSNQNSGATSAPKHSHKRPYASAFEKPQSPASRTPAPPPVPSFNNPLPAKPPAPVDVARKPRKKKRRHNQLGLTPKAEEHESSEEEDDVDEEAKLARGLDSGPLQFTYKGRTATLQSSADITAWIEERKKRFPTQARVEDKKKAAEEAKKVRNQALEARRHQFEARAHKEREKLERKAQREQNTDPIDAAVKAKLKADKLRRKLIKEEKRVAKAEADAERARLKAEALRQGATDPNAGRTDRNESDGLRTAMIALGPEDEIYSDVRGSNGVQAGVGAPSGPNPLEAYPGVPSISQHAAMPGNGHPEINGNLEDATLSTPSFESTDSSAETSSESDLSSLSDAEDSDVDADSAPEEASSRRTAPERVPPPRRDHRKTKKLCRHFLRKGRCSRGDRCRFLHERPDGTAKVGIEKRTEKNQRKGLLQVLLARQKEDEDQRVMETISWLGKHGKLDEPPTETGEPSVAMPGPMAPSG